MSRTALYRLFNAANCLLYVGIAVNPRIRFGQHAAEKTWWPQVASHTLEWHPTRPDAFRAEAAAIRDEDPLYNIRRHPYRPVRRPQFPGPVVVIQIQAARALLGDRATAARETGQHTVIERHGRPVAVLVPVGWYVSKGGDPRGPLPDVDPES